MQFRTFSKKNYIARFEMFRRIFLSELFWNQKIVSGSKIQKKTKKWCLVNRSRPMKWARETLISQWYLFICFLSAYYVASSRITTVDTSNVPWFQGAWTCDRTRQWGQRTSTLCVSLPRTMAILLSPPRGWSALTSSVLLSRWSKSQFRGAFLCLMKK